MYLPQLPSGVMRSISYSGHVLRISILAAAAALACVFFVACDGDNSSRITDAAPIDAPADATGSGSGSDDMAALEPSPKDRNLDLVVVASSLLVVVGPVVGSRRRRSPNIL